MINHTLISSFINKVSIVFVIKRISAQKLSLKSCRSFYDSQSYMILKKYLVLIILFCTSSDDVCQTSQIYITRSAERASFCVFLDSDLPKSARRWRWRGSHLLFSPASNQRLRIFSQERKLRN